MRSINLEPVQKDFQQMIQSLTTTFVEDLDHMDRGETEFFDMSVTRSLSIVSADAVDLGHKAGMAAKNLLDTSFAPVDVRHVSKLS
jgi:hypothetical protein